MNITFPNWNIGVNPNAGATGLDGVADEFQTNLIMPEPTVFLNPNLGPFSIIRPTSMDHSNAVAAVTALTNDGLFINAETGENTGVVDLHMQSAIAADAATRGRRRAGGRGRPRSE